MIAGAGPVGTVMATLLARAGIDVIVLEAGEDCAQDMRASTTLFLNAEPQTTGMIWMFMVQVRIAAISSASVNSSPPRYFSIRASS